MGSLTPPSWLMAVWGAWSTDNWYSKGLIYIQVINSTFVKKYKKQLHEKHVRDTYRTINLNTIRRGAIPTIFF